MDDLSGTVVDKYRLIRLLGSGGMGAVYEAEHELIGRRCAVKLLHPDVADEETTERMLRESRAAAAIGHANIVDSLDFGATKDGTHFLVMELLSGKSLAEVIKKHAPLPVLPTVAVVTQVVEALQAAHAVGIVHRDLKPDNVYILENPSGSASVKLLDFGVSLFRTEEAEEMRLTKTGAVMGTPYYMSPEQADGAHNVDGRADLWSVGVLMYEALMGFLPFPGNTFSQVILKIVMHPHEPVDVRRPDLPPDVTQIVDRALAKKPEGRFQSAGEMLVPLRNLLSSYQPGPDGLLSDLTTGTDVKPTLTDPGVTSPPLELSLPSLPSGTLPPPPPVTTMSPGQMVGRESRVGVPSGKSKAGTFLAVGIVVTIVAAAAAYLFLGRGQKSKTTPRASRTPPPAPAAMSATANLVVELRGLPPNAEVRLDGQVVETPLKLKGDDTEHALKVSAPGYLPAEQRFVAHAALRSMKITMQKKTEPPRPRVSTREVARPRRPARVSAPRKTPRASPARPRPRPRRRTTRRRDWAL